MSTVGSPAWEQNTSSRLQEETSVGTPHTVEYSVVLDGVKQDPEVSLAALQQDSDTPVQ